MRNPSLFDHRTFGGWRQSSALCVCARVLMCGEVSSFDKVTHTNTMSGTISRSKVINVNHLKFMKNGANLSCHLG